MKNDAFGVMAFHSTIYECPVIPRRSVIISKDTQGQQTKYFAECKHARKVYVEKNGTNLEMKFVRGRRRS